MIFLDHLLLGRVSHVTQVLTMEGGAPDQVLKTSLPVFRRAALADYPVSTSEFTSTELEALKLAVNEVSKTSGRTFSLRSLESLIFRYSLARRLVRAHGDYCSPYELTLPIAQAMMSLPSERRAYPRRRSVEKVLAVVS